MHLCLGILNAVKHRPVGENAVKEVVGHAQETVDVHLEVGADSHVRQFCFEAAQLGLKMRYRSLGVIETAVFHEIRDQAASHQIPGAPALGTV